MRLIVMPAMPCDSNRFLHICSALQRNHQQFNTLQLVLKLPAFCGYSVGAVLLHYTRNSKYCRSQELTTRKCANSSVRLTAT